MLVLFWRSIRDRKWTLLSYSVSGVVLLWMYVTLFPTIQETSAQVSALVKSLPEALTKAFALDPRSFTTFEGFVAGKHFSLLWPILVIMLAASFTGNAIAGRVDSGTIDLELALPVSRTKIYLSRLFSGMIGLLIFDIASVLSIIPLAGLYVTPYSVGPFVTMALVGYMFGLAALGISMFASSIFSEKGKALFASIALLLAMYVANIVALIDNGLDKLKYFSLFHYFDYTGILLDNKVATESWWVFAGIFVVSSFAGLYWFNRRDISV